MWEQFFALDQCWTIERHGGYVYVISTALGRNKPAGMILRRVPEAQVLSAAQSVSDAEAAGGSIAEQLRAVFTSLAEHVEDDRKP